MIRYRLMSTGMIHAPGLLAWIRNVALSDPDNAHRILAKSFPGMPAGLAQDFLDGAVTFDVDDDGAAVFTTDQEYLA